MVEPVSPLKPPKIKPPFANVVYILRGVKGGCPPAELEGDLHDTYVLSTPNQTYQNVRNPVGYLFVGYIYG